MGGLAVILLLLIIFLGIEGTREAIGGFFNFVLWGIVIILVLGLIAKIGDALKDNRTQEQIKEEENAKKKIEAEARAHERLIKEQRNKKQKAWAKKHPLLSRYLDFQSRHIPIMATIYTIIIVVILGIFFGLTATLKIAP